MFIFQPITSEFKPVGSYRFAFRTVGQDLNPFEDFTVLFFELKNIHSNAIVRVIKDFLTRIKLSMENCKSQTYVCSITYDGLNIRSVYPNLCWIAERYNHSLVKIHWVKIRKIYSNNNKHINCCWWDLNPCNLYEYLILRQH